MSVMNFWCWRSSWDFSFTAVDVLIFSYSSLPTLQYRGNAYNILNIFLTILNCPSLKEFGKMFLIFWNISYLPLNLSPLKYPPLETDLQIQSPNSVVNKNIRCLLYHCGVWKAKSANSDNRAETAKAGEFCSAHTCRAILSREWNSFIVSLSSK